MDAVAQLAPRLRTAVLRSSLSVQCGPQPCQVRRTEDDAVAGGDVDQVEVDAGLGDPAGEIGEHAGLVLDLDDHHLALAAHSKVRDGKGVPNGLGVGDEDVELGLIARSMQAAAAMFTPASLIAVATSASAPGRFSMSITRSNGT